MGRDKLRSLLKQLHGELEGAETADAEDRSLLGLVVADIEALLAGETASSTSGDGDSLEDRLEQGVVRFETRYPQLSFTLERIVEALANMGV